MASNAATNGKLWSQLCAKTAPFCAAGARFSHATRAYPDFARRALAHGSKCSQRVYGGLATPRPMIAQLATRRAFSSGGVLLLGANPSAAGTGAACAGAVEKSMHTATGLERRKSSAISGQLWKRSLHLGIRRAGGGAWKSPSESGIIAHVTKRHGSTDSKEIERSKSQAADKRSTATPKTPDGPNHSPEGNSYFHLPHLPHLPRMPHRPTKEELLAAATGFWSRLKIRFKWFSIRSVRPWNVDDWSAFVSWIVLGHIVWILLGTTTFFSLVIFAINTVVAQETLARWVGDYLTKSTGVKVVFENAVVPRWKDGVISFRNVFVSRRPGQAKSRVSKGSSLDAAAAAAAQRQAIRDNLAEREDDGNYTQYDVTINSVNVTLSFAKWWNGKGLLKDVETKGVRGVVDRTHVVWPDEYVDPRAYKHEHVMGDFEIDNFKMEDLLLTIHQPNNFRPYTMSVFTCELPQLRKQWLFYDFLSAKQMSGSFDGSLFNIHPHQSPSPAYQTADLEDEPMFKKHSRLRIDGLKIDHLNKGVEGPFGWIHEGNVDIVADIMFPADTDESLGKVMSDLYERMEATVAANRYQHILENQPHAAELNTPEHRTAFETRSALEQDRRFLVMDMSVRLNDVRAAVPLFTRELSYVNQALTRPIVAYINNRKTFIPIHCRIVKKASEFDGSWTIHDCGLMEDLSAEVYEAFAKDVTDSQARRRRFKKVGIWSVSLALQAVFMTMSGSLA